MITFSKLGELGRLGNQLFQYAALRGLSLKKNYQICLPNLNKKNWHGQKCLLTEFNIPETFFECDTPKINLKYYEPKWQEYDNNFWNIEDNTNIEGFFQSLFYFEEFSTIIKKELLPKEEHLEKAKIYVDNIKKMNEGYDIISIHVRRGDNLTNNQKGLIEAFDDDGVFKKYVTSAIDYFRKIKKVKFLVFTGGQRYTEDNSSDMDWCKKNFLGEDFIFSENSTSIEDFCRIMLCDHNILSHASSFGWWAAYQNKNDKKVVVAPKYYHPDEPNLIRPKFYPKNYILL